MIRIAICDDDAKFIKTEREIIEDYFAQKMLPYSIDCYFSGEELLKNVNEALNIDNDSERQMFINSGFKYKERSEDDTVERTLHMIEEHFGLV